MTSVWFSYPLHEIRSQRTSDALKTVIDLFNQRLQISIREGKANLNGLVSVLSTLIELDPFNVTDTAEFGFSWIAEVLNSGYTESERDLMASTIMELLGKYFYPAVRKGSRHLQPAWIPPLLGFLSLSEKFYPMGSPPYPGVVALRILSSSPRCSELGATILPILTSILLPTHPLQSRGLALEIFCRFMFDWIPLQTENVLDQDLDKLLRAVGDPFHFPSDPPPRAGRPAFAINYHPMRAIVVLIEFASSDLWRNYLHHSNFASCEETVSTEEGKRTALRWMLVVATDSWPKSLHTPAKITAVTRRLEELQCLNTAEVVIMWAWTAGVIDPADRDAWRSIERDTLRFCQTNGMGCPMALKRHITDASMEGMHTAYLAQHYEGVPCRVGSVRQLAPALGPSPFPSDGHLTDLRVSQVCQLRRLYHLFGYDPTTWREAVTAGEGEQTTGVLSGRPVAPVSFIDLVCDYP